jgi:hypothetical protein
VRLAKENRALGYDRIAGALANLGYEVCEQAVGNILQRRALPPSERSRSTVVILASLGMDECGASTGTPPTPCPWCTLGARGTTSPAYILA